MKIRIQNGVKLAVTVDGDLSSGPIDTSADSGATWTPVKQTHSDSSAFGLNQWLPAQNPLHAIVGKASDPSQLIESL